MKTFAALLLIGLLSPSAPQGHSGHHQAAASIAPEGALKRLEEGNARYRAGSTSGAHRDQARRCETFANGQHPIATILSCADSRAPVELLFDAGIGDLFVIRVAGNVADIDEIATIEYGVEHLGTPLVVVLGHTKCGAVTAVVNKAHVSENIAGLLDNILPASKKASQQHPDLRGDALIAETTKMNVWQSIEDLISRSAIVRAAAAEGKIKIVGGVYDLHEGTIEWLAEHPQHSSLLMSGSKQGSKPAPEAHSPHSQASPHDDAPAPHGSAPRGTASPLPAGKQRPHNWLAFGGLLAGATAVSGVLLHFVRGRAAVAKDS